MSGAQRCARCGGQDSGTLGLTYPFVGELRCRACATISIGVPTEAIDELNIRSLPDRWDPAAGDDLTSDFAGSMIRGLLDERGPAPPGQLPFLHPVVERLLRGLAVFEGSFRPLRREVLTSDVATALADRVRLGEITSAERALVEHSVPFDTPLPPELQGRVIFPGPIPEEISWLELIPWRFRFLAAQGRRDVQLGILRSEAQGRHALEAHSRWEATFVDELRLPVRGWRERLTLVVSASSGLVERVGREPRFVPVPRPDVDADADRRRKLLVLNYMMSRLSGRLAGTHLEVAHALYAGSLPAHQRGWAGLRPGLELRDGVLQERNVFTVSIPPDVDLDRLSSVARREIEDAVTGAISGFVIGVRQDDFLVPVAPGAAVVSALARGNEPRAVFIPKVDELLAKIETWDQTHGLCGCDDCLIVILTALREVFLLMPFRRSNRRLVYNFVLTYYLLRCRLGVVHRPGPIPHIEGVETSLPIVPWKTTEFVCSSLSRQRDLVREGQRRFLRLAEGELSLEEGR